MVRTLTAITAISAALTSLTIGIDTASDDKQGLQGEWRLVEREHKGKTTKKSDADFYEFQIVIKGDEMTSAQRR